MRRAISKCSSQTTSLKCSKSKIWQNGNESWIKKRDTRSDRCSFSVVILLILWQLWKYLKKSEIGGSRSMNGGESRGVYRVLVGKPEGKRPLGCPRRRRKDNIKMYLIILWTGDTDLRLYITNVQYGWRTPAFLTRAWFPRTIHCLVSLHKGECFQRYLTLQHYLYSISWKFQFTKIDSEFVINF